MYYHIPLDGPRVFLILLLLFCGKGLFFLLLFAASSPCVLYVYDTAVGFYPFELDSILCRVRATKIIYVFVFKAQIDVSFFLNTRFAGFYRWIFRATRFAEKKIQSNVFFFLNFSYTEELSRKKAFIDSHSHQALSRAFTTSVPFCRSADRRVRNPLSSSLLTLTPKAVALSATCPAQYI